MKHKNSSGHFLAGKGFSAVEDKIYEIHLIISGNKIFGLSMFVDLFVDVLSASAFCPVGVWSCRPFVCRCFVVLPFKQHCNALVSRI